MALNTKVLGNRIKDFRRQRGLTQGEFADAICVSFQAVSNWERGITPPELENLINIAQFFGVLVDDLLRPSTDELFLGIDGGGTSTEFVVTDSQGTVVFNFSLSGSNPNDIGFERSFELISGGIRDALIKFPRISNAFLGIAGVSVGDHSERMTSLLSKKFPSLKLKVVTDSANLFGADDTASLAVIGGTGSVVFVKRGQEFRRIGGWGYLFDNAGSAYDIGRDAVTAALEQEDLSLAPTSLTLALREKLKVSSVFDAIHDLYGGGKAYIASLATLVFDAYRNGDESAAAIIDRNARAIGERLSTGVSLYGVAPIAIAGGGLFEHYSDILLPHIRKYTSVTIKVCSLPPVYGACRQSVKLANHTVCEFFEDNFKSTYGGK